MPRTSDERPAPDRRQTPPDPSQRVIRIVESRPIPDRIQRLIDSNFKAGREAAATKK